MRVILPFSMEARSWVHRRQDKDSICGLPSSSPRSSFITILRPPPSGHEDFFSAVQDRFPDSCVIKVRTDEMASVKSSTMSVTFPRRRSAGPQGRPDRTDNLGILIHPDQFYSESFLKGVKHALVFRTPPVMVISFASSMLLASDATRCDRALCRPPTISGSSLPE